MIYILYLSCLLLGGIGAWLISRFAFKWGFVDRPNRRSSHYSPTPKGGGIGILAAFLLASLFIRIPIAFWMPATFLGLLSFLDPQITQITQITPVPSSGATGQAQIDTD